MKNMEKEKICVEINTGSLLNRHPKTMPIYNNPS